MLQIYKRWLVFDGTPQAIMPIEAGKRYVLINKKSGTALDLDTRDNRSVQGWSRHGKANQQVS